MEHTEVDLKGRPKPFPIRLAADLRAKLQLEAEANGLELSPYLVSLIESRHNTPQAADKAEIEKLRLRVESQRNLLQQCLETFKSWGISTESIRQNLKDNESA